MKQPENNDHPLTFIEYGDQQAWVDEEIADIILDLWKLGIKTEYSCQGYPGGKLQDDCWAYILFPDANNLERFVEIAHNLCKGDRIRNPEDNAWVSSDGWYSPVVDYWLPTDRKPLALSYPDRPERWEYQFQLQKNKKTGKITLRCNLKFPHEDIPLVREAINKWLSR